MPPNCARASLVESCGGLGGRAPVELGAWWKTGLAAALGAARILAEADFLSIGSNDRRSTRPGPPGMRACGARRPAAASGRPQLTAAAATAGSSAARPVAVCGSRGRFHSPVPLLVGLGVRNYRSCLPPCRASSVWFDPSTIDSVCVARRTLPHTESAAEVPWPAKSRRHRNFRRRSILPGHETSAADSECEAACGERRTRCDREGSEQTLDARTAAGTTDNNHLTPRPTAEVTAWDRPATPPQTATVLPAAAARRRRRRSLEDAGCSASTARRKLRMPCGPFAERFVLRFRHCCRSKEIRFAEDAAHTRGRRGRRFPMAPSCHLGARAARVPPAAHRRGLRTVRSSAGYP